MLLSSLQKYILKEALARGLLSKRQIERYYEHTQEKPSEQDIQTIITKSVERLIFKELIVGFGKKTAQKWFVKEIRLTRKGRKIARELLGKQQQLPFHSLLRKSYVHPKKNSQSP